MYNDEDKLKIKINEILDIMNKVNVFLKQFKLKKIKYYIKNTNKIEKNKISGI